MANNRRKFQFQYSMQREIVNLSMKAAIGATGAVTISTLDAKGVTSITRNSAGNYTILLQDTYPALMHMNVMVLNATATAAPSCQIISEAVVTTGAIVIQFLAPGGTAVDPDNGATIMVSMTLRNVLNSTTA